MKLSVLLYILFNTALAQAQNLPVFVSDSTHSSEIDSFVFSKIKTKYNYLISYTAECYWPTEQLFYVLVHNTDKWKFYRLKVKFKSQDKTIDNILSTSKKKKRIKDDKLDSLFNYWTEVHFWELENDLLNYPGRGIEDDKLIYIGSTDGCSDKFEVITKDKHNKFEIYNVDEFQKEYPSSQRESFILGRNKFYQITKEK